MTSLPVLSFDRITKSFDGAIILDNLSFLIPENKIVGLIGANGAGKTTSLRHIIRYYVPDDGTIFYRSKDIYKLPDDSFPVAYIPDTPVFYEELTVREHLSFLGAAYQTSRFIEELIDMYEMNPHLNKVPSILSRGTKQKLMIMCALLHTYDILIADEPFTGLDPIQIKVFRDNLLRIKDEGKTIVLSTHLLNMIESICDYYVMIDHGKLVGQGKLSDFIQADGEFPTFESLYLHLSQQVGENIESGE